MVHFCSFAHKALSSQLPWKSLKHLPLHHHTHTSPLHTSFTCKLPHTFYLPCRCPPPSSTISHASSNGPLSLSQNMRIFFSLFPLVRDCLSLAWSVPHTWCPCLYLSHGLSHSCIFPPWLHIEACPSFNGKLEEGTLFACFLALLSHSLKRTCT